LLPNTITITTSTATAAVIITVDALAIGTAIIVPMSVHVQTLVAIGQIDVFKRLILHG
jgi:hypothetical protein